MSAATRLETALWDAMETLLEVVGVPADDSDNGTRRPVSGSLVNRDEVPHTAHTAACYALTILMVGCDAMGPETSSLSVEEGLALATGEAT